MHGELLGEQRPPPLRSKTRSTLTWDGVTPSRGDLLGRRGPIQRAERQASRSSGSRRIRCHQSCAARGHGSGRRAARSPAASRTRSRATRCSSRSSVAGSAQCRSSRTSGHRGASPASRRTAAPPRGTPDVGRAPDRPARPARAGVGPSAERRYAGSPANSRADSVSVVGCERGGERVGHGHQRHRLARAAGRRRPPRGPSAASAAALTRRLLPMPASPATTSRPVPDSRWRRTAAELCATRPARRPGVAQWRPSRVRWPRARVDGSCGCHRSSSSTSDLEEAPGRQARRGEHRRDGGVAAAGRLGQGAQAGPAGAVVQVVEGLDQVAVGAGREVGARQGGHGPPSPLTDSRSDCPVLSGVVNRVRGGTSVVVSTPRPRRGPHETGSCHEHQPHHRSSHQARDRP